MLLPLLLLPVSWMPFLVVARNGGIDQLVYWNFPGHLSLIDVLPKVPHLILVYDSTVDVDKIFFWSL